MAKPNGVICQGEGQISDSTVLELDTYLEAGTKRRIHILYPKGIGDWVPSWVISVIEGMNYTSYRDMYFIMVIGRMFKAGLPGGAEVIGGFNGFFLPPNHIFVTAGPRVYGYLKRANPETRICDTLVAFGEILWHEIFHFKRDRGMEFPVDEDLRRIAGIFWDRIR